MADTHIEVKKAAPATTRPASVDAWQSFRSEMDRLFDRFSSGFGFPALRRMLDVEPLSSYEASFNLVTPAVDVTEDDKSYKISAELPGMSDKDVGVSLSGDMLIIKGEKRQEKEEKDKNRYMSERSYGSFQRGFSLPEGVDRDKITAEFSKGVLAIVLPKTAEAAKQKKIEVRAA